MLLLIFKCFLSVLIILFHLCLARPDNHHHETLIRSDRNNQHDKKEIAHLLKYDRLIFNLNKDELSVEESMLKKSKKRQSAENEKKSLESTIKPIAAKSLQLETHSNIIKNDSVTLEQQQQLHFILNSTLNLSNITDDDSNMYEVNSYVKTFLSMIYGVISVLSVFGNGLIIWAVRRNKRMHNVTNYFISNLAMADVVIGLFATPFQVKQQQQQFFSFIFFNYFIKLFVNVCFFQVSSGPIATMGVSRYNVQSGPIRGHTKRKRVHIHACRHQSRPLLRHTLSVQAKNESNTLLLDHIYHMDHGHIY
jgi:hypothetical protein